jgi:hypothetical protein
MVLTSRGALPHIDIRAICPAGISSGKHMSLWFSNRGQMIQVTCAVLAVIIGIAAQWNQLSVAINFGEILKVLLYPVAVLIGFQLGKRALKPPAQAPTPREPPSPPPREALPDLPSTLGPDFIYKFSTPVIKVGSYFDVGQELGLRRVSVSSVKTVKAGTGDVPAAEIEITGHALDFGVGRTATAIHSKKALIPAYARSLKDADCSMFEFSYQPDAFSFAAISVDHINVPAQEVTLVICLANYRKRSSY